MNKFTLLLISLISMINIVLPKNRVSNNGYDETLSQITYNNDEKVMIKPLYST